MSRTFRHINIKPSLHKYLYGDNEIGISVYLNGIRRSYRSIELDDIDKEFYELYRDKRHTSYKYYRKYEEQQYKTYCKQFIRDSLRNNECGSLKPVTRACSGYWD